MAKAQKTVAPSLQHDSFFTGMKAKLILVLICVLCYGNTLLNKYALDDDFAVYENPLVQKGLQGIPEILTSPYLNVNNKSADYRPIVGISFAIENQFFGNNPHVSHFVNLVLYSILILIIFPLLSHVFQLDKLHPALPLCIAIFYAIHPSHTEVVASIKNRDEIFSFIFSATALKFSYNFFTQHQRRFYYGGLTLLFMTLAYFSKVVSMPVVGVIIFMGIFYGFWKQRQPFIILVGCLVILNFAYFAGILLTLKKPLYDLENPLADITNLSLNLGTIFETLLFYLRFILVPYPFRFYYGYNMIPVIPVFDPVSIISFFIHLGILVYGIRLFRKKELLGLFIISYLANIFFYSNFFKYAGIVSERTLFIPTLWFIAAFVLLLFKLGKFQKEKGLNWAQKGIIAAGILIVAGYTGLTIWRNFQWKDRLTLMRADMPHLKNSTLANYFFAEALTAEKKKSNSKAMRRQYTTEAKKYYKQALQVSPGYSDPYYELGMIYEYEEHNRDSAFYYFYNGNRLNPAHNPTKFQLSKQYYLRENDAKAEELLSQLYGEMPTDTFTLYFYARALFNMQKQQQAFSVNEKLMKLNPSSPYAYVNYGLFYQNSGDIPKAAANYEKALMLGFRDEAIFNSLLNYYMETNQTEKVAQLQKLQ